MANPELKNFIFDRLHVLAWGIKGEPVGCKLGNDEMVIRGEVIESSLLKGTIDVGTTKGEIVRVPGRNVT